MCCSAEHQSLISINLEVEPKDDSKILVALSSLTIPAHRRAPLKKPWQLVAGHDRYVVHVEGRQQAATELEADVLQVLPGLVEGEQLPVSFIGQHHLKLGQLLAVLLGAGHSDAGCVAVGRFVVEGGEPAERMRGGWLAECSLSRPL